MNVPYSLFSLLTVGSIGEGVGQWDYTDTENIKFSPSALCWMHAAEDTAAI